MMKNLLKTSLLFFLLAGCSEEEGMLCDTGPVIFTFEVVEAASGENVFESGVYKVGQMEIADKAGKAVDFELAENGVLKVLLGWEAKSDVYTVTIADEVEFDIIFRLEESRGEFCSSTVIKDLEVVGLPSETSGTTGITTIYVQALTGE